MAYDAANRMTRLVNLNSTNTTLSYFDYVFDHVGDRTSVWDNGTDVSNWTYDSTGQMTNDIYRPATTALNWTGLTVHQWYLLSADDWYTLAVDDVPTGGAGTLAYDPAGNRLTQIDPVTGDVTTFAYDNGNQLVHGEDVSGLTTYTYDPNGNQLTIEEPSGDITTNTWDGENRLVQVEHPSSDVTTYAYNGDGLRVSQDDGVVETRYVHDGNNVLLETDDVGTVEAEFTYIPQAYAQVISQHRNLDSSFYLFDGTHNVRQLTDNAQVVTDDYRFDAWGNQINSTGSTANSQLWKGQFLAYRKDPDAGPELQYATHHRNYNPQTGVFTSADPAKDDSNLYRYVKNNPINDMDPSGLQEDDDDVLNRGYYGQLQREYWSSLRWQEGYKQLNHWTKVLETTTDPYSAANAREHIEAARAKIQWYDVAIMRDVAAERAAQRGQTLPPTSTDDAVRRQVEGEFNSLERAEQAAFSGFEVPAIGQPLTPAATIGGSPFISLDKVTDNDLARMSASQKLLLAIQYADKKDMIAGEMGVAIRELMQPENLAIVAGIGAPVFGLGAVAGAAAGSSGPPGWFTALVGAGFASLAVGNVGLKAYELKLELDITTRVGEIPSSARIASELLAMIPVEVLMAMVAHVVGQLGGKVGAKARELVRKWKEQRAELARNSRPQGDFDNYGSETLDVVESVKPPIRHGETMPSGKKGSKPDGPRTKVRKGDNAPSDIRENQSADILADVGYTVVQNPAKKPNGKAPDYLIEGQYFDNIAPEKNTSARNVADRARGKVAVGQVDRVVVNLNDSKLSPGNINAALRRAYDTPGNEVRSLKEAIVIKDGTIVHFLPSFE